MGTNKFKQDQLSLDLQKNSEGVYLPPNAVRSEKLTQGAHVLTLHGGVCLTITYIRRDCWIPRLRRLKKKVIRGCFGCKRFQATAFQNPPPGNLPIERTTGSVPFQVVAVDYAGPISYKASSKRETGKAYILLFACSLTTAIHLELLSDQTTVGFIKSFKRFIARRRSQKVYSDNGRSFVAAARWLRRMKGRLTTYPEIISPGSLTSVEPLGGVVSLRG